MDRRREEENETELERHGFSTHPSVVVRTVLVACGTVAVVLGFIGIFLPVMPTTPFLLVAAACYARSSERFYRWLLTNRWFGKYIVAWRLEHRIPLHAKIAAVTMIVTSVGASIVWFIPITAVKILLAAVAIWVIIYICRQKS